MRKNLVANGKKSFAIVASRYGMQWIAERVAIWRRGHPSSIEISVMEWLDELGYSYMHDAPFRGYMVYADFIIPSMHVVIEVDGKGFHGTSQTEWLGDGNKRTEKDAAKDALYAQEGYRLLRLCEKDVRNGTGRQQLLEFLERGTRHEIYHKGT